MYAEFVCRPRRESARGGQSSWDGLTFAGAIAAIDWTQALSGAIDAAQFNIGNLLGGYLGHEPVPAQTREGAIGGQLFGAIGSFVLPGGLGSLIGTSSAPGSATSSALPLLPRRSICSTRPDTFTAPDTTSLPTEEVTTPPTGWRPPRIPSS